jgi:hypothetical protein
MIAIVERSANKVVAAARLTPSPLQVHPLIKTVFGAFPRTMKNARDGRSPAIVQNTPNALISFLREQRSVPFSEPAATA